MGQQQPRTAAEILLSALSQAKVLTSLVNRTLKLSEEEAMAAMAIKTQEEKMATGVISEQQRIVAKGERLIEITTAINKQLTLLLAIIQDNEREREALKRELSKSQDQVNIHSIDKSKSKVSKTKDLICETASNPTEIQAPFLRHCTRFY